ncbi:MAG: CidA/LrgA family protein [Rhodospirillales bacterium]|jgi:holin-like protein|nr:CidA/LrgA family protein [Rhodospirillales bacterium]
MAGAVGRAAFLGAGFAVVLACLWAGGRLAPLLPLRLPGALVGMLLLAGLLSVHRGGAARAASRAGDLLLRRYALFFVPAGVGVMTRLAALRADWLAVAAALLASSLLALVVTALAMRACLSLCEKRRMRSFCQKRRMRRAALPETLS